MRILVQLVTNQLACYQVIDVPRNPNVSDMIAALHLESFKYGDPVATWVRNEDDE